MLPRGGQFYTESIFAQNALSDMLRRAEVADLWQNASGVTHKTWNFSQCTKRIRWYNAFCNQTLQLYNFPGQFPPSGACRETGVNLDGDDGDDDGDDDVRRGRGSCGCAAAFPGRSAAAGPAGWSASRRTYGPSPGRSRTAAAKRRE